MALLVLSACSCAKPGVLWVVDTLWAPLLGEDFETQVRDAERELGTRIETVPYSFKEKEKIELSSRIKEKGYEYLVLSPYALMELQSLAAQFPNTLFFCMDAPETISFLPNVRGIAFDPLPALTDALQKWKEYSGSPGSGQRSQTLCVVSEQETYLLRELGISESTPDTRVLVITNQDSDESLRARLRRELSRGPFGLLILWTRKGMPLIVESLSLTEKKRWEGVVGYEIHRIPGIKDLPFRASLRKEYPKGLVRVLKGPKPFLTKVPYGMYKP